jgi:hypothetical protein
MSAQFSDRYRERNVSQPREMLTVRNAPVDLTRWQRISAGSNRPGLLRRLASSVGALFERVADLLARPRRNAR